MGSVCLSSASILRCTSLSQLENILLVIPTALEVIFSTSLIFTNRNAGRRHLLLTAEGWIYLVLTVTEMLSNVVPAVRENLAAFKAFDTGIGVASFLPLFFYTFFFFLFTGSDLLETVPKSISNVAKYSLILFIPAIVIFNESGSFTGIVIRKTVLPGKPADSKLFIQFFFTDAHAELLWAFFTSVTLALLAAFQAAVFSFAFFRLVRALLKQRSIENKGADKAILFNGIVWLCAAIKIGALESVVGFFGGGFGIALTRRIMRMVSRACLVVGVAKGVDILEDFQVMQHELRKSSENRRDRRLSQLQLLISSPRISTFRQLSPTAAAFHASHAVQNVASVEKDKSSIGQGPHYTTWSQRQSKVSILSGLPGMKDFASIKEERMKQRVLVLQDQEGAPKLHMRFSMLDVPTPAVIVESLKNRPRSEEPGSVRTPYLSGLTSEYTYDKPKDAKFVPPVPSFHQDFAGTDLRDSFNSLMNSPYEIVDARKLPQTVAVGQLYQPPFANRTQAGDAMAVMPLPGYQASSVPPAQPQIQDSDEQIQERDTDRIKSVVSSKSRVDSIADAVRDLANQFPGPPEMSQTRPSENRVILRTPQVLQVRAALDPIKSEKSVWEEDSRTSAQYPSGGGTIPQALGSPSELTFGKRSTQPSTAGLGMEDDLMYRSSLEGSALAYAEGSPIKAGKVPVTRAGYRTSSALRKSKASEKVAIDPFSDEEYRQLPKTPKTPLSAPAGRQMGPSVKFSVSETPVPIIRKPLDSPQTPTTGFSGLSRIRESIAPNRVDPFVDFAMALDTGKSRQFRPGMPSIPQAPPISARNKMSKSEEKLYRIAAWVDTSANAAVAQSPIDPELPVTREELVARPVVQGQPRDNSLQNLHDRGKSMDALAIPWMKGALSSGGNDAPVNDSYEASALRPSRPQIKTVGKVPNRPTPAPVHIGHTRGSLYLEPIIIPPRNGNTLPQIENSTPQELATERYVLRDDEVLNIESVMGTRRTIGSRF